MSEIKLLPCPFCGGEAKFSILSHNWIECTMCKMGTDYIKDKEKLVRMWNTRKPMQEIVERLEEQAEECRKYWNEFDDEDSFGGMNAYCDAISIVKEVGGMNE